MHERTATLANLQTTDDRFSTARGAAFLATVAVLIAAATVWAGSLHSADATPPVAIEINAPPQTVIVGETLGVFDARVVICADNQADGFVTLFLRDGTAFGVDAGLR